MRVQKQTLMMLTKTYLLILLFTSGKERYNMANTKPTKRLIEKKIQEVTAEVEKQQAIVNALKSKRDNSQNNYDAALAKLTATQSELSDYQKDKVK